MKLIQLWGRLGAHLWGYLQLGTVIPANTTHRPNVGPQSTTSARHWPTLGRCVVLAVMTVCRLRVSRALSRLRHNYADSKHHLTSTHTCTHTTSLWPRAVYLTALAVPTPTNIMTMNIVYCQQVNISMGRWGAPRAEDTCE